MVLYELLFLNNAIIIINFNSIYCLNLSEKSGTIYVQQHHWNLLLIHGKRDIDMVADLAELFVNL